jgi:hypothetical protein
MIKLNKVYHKKIAVKRKIKGVIIILERKIKLSIKQINDPYLHLRYQVSKPKRENNFL